MENYHQLCVCVCVWWWGGGGGEQEETKQGLLLGKDSRKDSVFSAPTLNFSTTIFFV